jgi:hypothetical protein
VTFSVFSPDVGAGKTAITCAYSTTKLVGTASNTGALITFSNQNINTLQKKASSAFCPAVTGTAAALTFSAIYGPVADTSVKGSPHLFVN